MLFCLLSFWVFGTYAAQGTGKIDCGTILLARPYSPIHSSSAKPYVPFSFNLGRDIKVAHLRPILEILKKGVELFLLEPNAFADFPLRAKEVYRDEVQEGNLFEDFCDTIYSMGHPLVLYSRKPGKNSVINRIHYKICGADTEDCIPIYIRTGTSTTLFAVGYETELKDEHTEVSQCDFASHVDLLKRVYNVQMNTPKTIPQTMTLSVFNVEVSRQPTSAALVIYLLEKDNPEYYWDLLREYIKNYDKYGTIARVSMKRFKETGAYCLVILLCQEPDEETLRSVRALVRPFSGYCSAFFASVNKVGGISMFTSIRLTYSETILSITGPNKRSKVSAVIANESEFLECIAKHNDGVAFRLGRTFLNDNIIDEFNARVTTPMHGRKIVFEKIVQRLYYENTKWSDNISFIDLRHDGGHLKLTVMFRLLKEKERQEVQDFVIAVVGDIYVELTGNSIQTGSSEVIHLPPRKHVLVKTEAKKESLAVVNSNTEQVHSEKKRSKKAHSKKKAKSSKAESKIDEMTTEVKLSEPIKKPTSRPKNMTKLQNWLFYLTDEEFELELRKFSERLHPLNYEPEMNYWKALAFQDGAALTNIIDRYDFFLNSPGNFYHVMDQVYQNSLERRCAKSILLMLVNRNYFKAGSITATASSMSCKFPWSPLILLLITNLVKRYTEILMTWREFYRITRLGFDLKVESGEVSIAMTIEIPDEHAKQIDDISYSFLYLLIR